MATISLQDDRAAFAPASLKAVFSGEHAWCGERMMLSEELEGGIPLSDFFLSGAFAAALDKYSASYGTVDRRAAASMWSLYYFSSLTIPYVVARRADQALPIAVETMSIALGEDGLPRAFGLSGDGDWSEGHNDDLPSLVLPLVKAHLAEIVARLKSHGGIAPKLSWNNAAVYIDYAFNVTARERAADNVHWPSKSLFDAEHLPDGTTNPFLGCLRHEAVGTQTQCRRKVCCLRYLLPGIPSCGELCALPAQRKQ